MGTLRRGQVPPSGGRERATGRTDGAGTARKAGNTQRMETAMCVGWTWGRGRGRAAAAAPVPAGRKQGGSAGPGQEGSRWPRGRRKSGGKARGRGGGGGRKPGPGEGLPRCTCVPRGHRGRAWVLREGASAVPSVGPKLPWVPGKGPSWVSPRLQMPLCRLWGCRSRHAPPQPRAGTPSLAPQRGRSCNRFCSAAGRGHSTQLTCAGGRTAGTPLRWSARWCCCPQGSWLGSDQGAGSPRGIGVGLGVLMTPWTSERAQGCSACTVPRMGPLQSLTPTWGVGDLPGSPRSPPHPQVLGKCPRALQSLRSPPFSPQGFPAQLTGVI